jgi:hypothetical protein
LAILLAAVPLAAREQTQASPDSSQAESRDQLREQLPPGFMDSTSTIIPSVRQARRKSPGGALLRSLVLPGWGQFYTGHGIRGTITAVAETAFLTGMVIKFRDRADLRDRLSALERENGPEWPVDDPLRVQLNRQIKDAQQSGGDYLAYGATALVLGMIDAYVSAHLYNFDRHFALSPSGRGRLTFALRF